MRRALAALLLVALVGAGVVATRAIWEGRSALAEGERARERGDAAEATRRFRRAARWYVPGAPHVRQAYDRLEAMAEAAETRGALDEALAAWRGVRGSILATRTAYTPFDERLESADRHIARLMAALEDDSLDRDESEREAWHRDRLARIEAPSRAWTLVALCGLGLWVGAGILFATRGVTPGDTLARRPAAAAGILLATGLLLWFVGLASA